MEDNEACHPWPSTKPVPPTVPPGGYQAQDWEIVDYCLEIPPTGGVPFRGPLPSQQDIEAGNFIAFLGGSQTFGRFVQTPFPKIVEAQFGIPVLNLGRVGAKPRFYLDHPELLAPLQLAKCVVIQVLSAQWCENSLLAPVGSNVLELTSKTGLPEGKLSPKSMWTHLVETEPGDYVMELVKESRIRYLDEMRELIGLIKRPKILFWFSRRGPRYQASPENEYTLRGGFPHFVDDEMVGNLKSLVGRYAECVTLPEYSENEYFSRFDGKKVAVFNRKYARDYPTQKEHNQAAETLIPVIRDLLSKPRISNEPLFTPHQATGRPDFITAAHYFGRASMANFWNTFERRRVHGDFQDISADGFNTIILIVPWAHFQTRINPLAYDKELLDRLAFLIKEARSFGFYIILRLGYLYENAPVKVNTYRRYQQLFSDADTLVAWKDYLAKIEGVVGPDARDVTMMLTWEDVYWPVLRHPEHLSVKERILFAKKIGLTEYLEKRFSFDLLRTLYDVSAASFDELPAPTKSEKLFAEFALFFDRNYVEPWLLASRAVLSHELWYEHRIDPDVIKLEPDGALTGKVWCNSVEHSTYKTGVACDAIYYHSKLGEAGSGQVNALQAAEHVKKVLKGFRGFNVYKKPLFLDQFNFNTNNPKHPEIAGIAEEQIPGFLESLVPVFRLNLTGYGIWGYRDWRDDRIFNGAFELGLSGWEVREAGFHEEESGNYVSLSEGSVLAQKCTDSGNPHVTSAFVTLECLPAASPVDLEISNGLQTEYKKVAPDTSVIEAVFPALGEKITIRCASGAINIHKIANYSHTFTNGMRGIDGSRSNVLRLLAKFNEELTGNLK